MVRLTVCDVLAALSNSCSVETLRRLEVIFNIIVSTWGNRSVCNALVQVPRSRDRIGSRLCEAAVQSRAASTPHRSFMIVQCSDYSKHHGKKAL